MTSRSSPGQILTAPLFLASLLLLGVNDWLLKPTFHNALTGKLSDVAGLFVLVALLCDLLPAQRLQTSLAVASVFAFWKLHLSDCVFAILIERAHLCLFRVADPSDLGALIVVPLAASYRPPTRWRFHFAVRLFSLAIVALLLGATSRIQHRVVLTTDNQARQFALREAESRVIERLERCGYHPYTQHFLENGQPTTSVLFYVNLSGQVQLRSVMAYATFATTPSGPVLEIRDVRVPGRSSPYTDQEVREAFSSTLQACLDGGS